MRIVITGAAGGIGRQIVEELSPSHELCLIDREQMAGKNSIVADLSNPPVTNGWRSWFKTKSWRWSDAFEKAEVVVHLAGNKQQLAPWEKVLPDNIHATWNVLEAAAMHRVPRVVFASSNWAVKALEQKLAPDCYVPDGPKIDSLAPPCPVNAYGLSKAFGEIGGQMFVNELKLSSFVAVRIGYYNPIPSHDQMLDTRWIGAEDMRGLLRCCVEAEFDGFHVVYGVSAQPTSPYDLSHTRDLLSWQPRQSSS